MLRIPVGGSAALDGVSLTGVEQMDGGSDEDELVGPDGDATWTITGPGAGTVGGLAFSGMEGLTGAADNADTFVVEAGGGLEGGAGVEGAPGGSNTLGVAGTYAPLMFPPTGPDSGYVARDGDVITYAGLEP